MDPVIKLSDRDSEITRMVLKNCMNQLRIVLSLVEDDNDPDNDQKLKNFVINSLRITDEELESENTFTLLIKIVDLERRKHSKGNGPLFNLNKYENELIQLDTQISEIEASFQTEMNFKKRIIEEQTNELQSLKIRNESELEFEKKWLAVQVEENDLRCQLEETNIVKQIENLKHDIEEEQKVHNEVLWYYRNEQQKVKELISHWNERFGDIEQLKAEIKNLLQIQKTQFNELNHLKTMYFKRRDEMLEYEADKERRRKEYEFELYRHKMATKIQAWWRGVMVRRGLGPFKNLLKAKDLRKRKMSLKKSVRK